MTFSTHALYCKIKVMTDLRMEGATSKLLGVPSVAP